MELIFIKNDLDLDDRIQLRDFASSNFLENVDALTSKVDLSDKFHYFDYEHFYVFCYLFNELDEDEDGFIGRAELEKYCKHNINSASLERICSGSAIKFSSANRSISSIDFCNFIRFVVYEEDKMVVPSITFWFKILDVDGDGVLRYGLTAAPTSWRNFSRSTKNGSWPSRDSSSRGRTSFAC